ncbi:AraC family transcriptional regulator [Noviherbaspirillum saxi]|uniref:AraC family transcriptional regulator n=1 Tax=Noviherbaspirillum saxi TaxID=2320863 RepID=A0A3A3FS82_9BURK|nr:AraC family transcriptional regulator [Noviherbaspirillum saxi]RJF98633.1 AraC family transcriptional regulator [Noviherbaspirillum saxi]
MKSSELSAQSSPPIGSRYTTATWVLRLLTEYSEELGLPAEDLLRRVGNEPGLLDDHDGRLPCDDFVRACAYVVSQFAIPHLGLRLGERMRPRYLGAYGFAVLSCSNMRELFVQLARYTALASNVGHIWVEENETAFIRYWRSFMDQGEPTPNLLDEMAMASWITTARQTTGNPAMSPRWVAFRHSAPADLAPYQNLFRCEIRFDADEVALCFDREFLDVKLPQGDARVHALMTALCDRLLTQIGDPSEPKWLTDCRRVIINAFRNGEPDVGYVAKILGLPPSVLRQKLKQHALYFRTFVDELRHDLALTYLADHTLALLDIAYLLGFSEQSAFQRAFKRWTGKTPGEYRKQSLGNADS